VSLPVCGVNSLLPYSAEVVERVEPYFFSPLDLYGLSYSALYIYNLRINMPYFLGLARAIIPIGKKIYYFHNFYYVHYN
jgi:hypothetical protein